MSGDEQFGIGAVARTTGLSVRAIRYYEQIGLVHAARRHDPAARTGGSRRYDKATIERLRFIRQARALGLALSEIRQLNTLFDSGTCPGSAGALRPILDRHRDAIERRIGELRALHGRIEVLLDATSTEARGAACGGRGCECLDTPSARAVVWSGPGIESAWLVSNSDSGGPE